MEANTRWVDVFSGSNRTGGQTPISGFVGSARYVCDGVAWRALLPWLLWGQVTQVGKDTVKGNGVFRVERLGDSSDE
jgi:CRISPR/Cas system endoribonuclease Cas6 (RAMP superfamily)